MANALYAPIRVAMADDHEFFREGFQVLIKKQADIEMVGEAENGEEAIAKFLDLRPDVVTMDLVMPHVSGVEGLVGILKHDPKAKVIVISALDQKQELKSAISAGAFDFIVKPFDQERVNNAIRKATE